VKIFWGIGDLGKDPWGIAAGHDGYSGARRDIEDVMVYDFLLDYEMIGCV
jgi:hypothetical protein